jgi:hypothetical protein
VKTLQQRQADLEASLQQYLFTTQPHLREKALNEVQAQLVRPGLLLATPQLTSTHRLRREALILSDAFEAVTNGMETLEVMEALQEVGTGSLFLPWKHLVLAVHFFYEGLDEAALHHLDQMDDRPPLNALRRALEAVLKKSPQNPAGQALYQLIHVPDPELASLTQQLTDTLESEQELLFWSVLGDFLEAAGQTDEVLAKRVALWTWNQLEWQSFDEAYLLELTTQLWGRAEAFRLAALGSVSWDAEGATLLWARFVIHGLREGALESESLLAAFQLAGEFLEVAREQQGGSSTSEWEDTWALLAGSLSCELALRRYELPKLPYRAAHLPPLTAVRSSSGRSGQLDLFAS